MTSSPSAQVAYPPQALREYALLADGERGALVGPRGEIVWMCFPRWHSDAVFGSLIGAPGSYAVTPEERFVWGGSYAPGTLIWISRWVTAGGAIVESRDALALPATPDRAVILRRLRVLEGETRLRVALNPSGGFGATPLRGLVRGDDGSWRGRVGETRLRWDGASAAREHADGHRGRMLELVLRMRAGEQHDLVLSLDGTGEREDDRAIDPDHLWSATEAAWDERVAPLDDTIAPRDARHAHAVLAGLTSASGGMVAAATTSLPERADANRSYDYRYVWIRDQCYTGQAAAKAGVDPLLDDAVRFVTARLLDDGSRLVPAYTVDGQPVPDQRRLELPGYPGGNDLVGNWVNEQFQLDAFGESLLLFAAAAGRDRLDADGWRAAELAAAAIEERWREPDAGVWELDPANWTHSRLMCVAGLRQISTHAPGGELAAHWLALADTIMAATAATGVHPSGRWQRAPTDDRLDAALLAPALRGALPFDDPRSLATLAAVDAELTEDGYCYRFRQDARPLGAAEGAFALCGFWMALAHSQQGQHVQAARWFERNRAACGPPALLSEEFDVSQRQLRGNLPQAFVHALLLECAAELTGSSETSDAR